jgi:putative FmdB family regulatory protein
MTYNYECSGCGNTLDDVEQKITDRPKKKCPRCGRMKLQRLISGNGIFILSGGGWYTDGYQNP